MSSDPSYPPLKRQEIETCFEAIPVYTLTSTENDSILLINDDENKKNIANFYLSKEFAEKIASDYYENNKVKVEGYSLGRIYFEVFDRDATGENSVKVISSNENPVEYRLVPDPREREQARSILSQLASIDTAFKEPFNEVPLFMDQHIRLASGEEDSDDYKEFFPIYFGWEDLVKTCQQYVEAYEGSGQEYEAAISVSDLKQLIAQMQLSNPVDFRNVAFVPATPRTFQN